MKKYELLNQLLNEKAEAMKTIEELCAEWNISLSDKEAQVINNITINKGKIVEVEVTKEIIIDNTNEEEIKELKDELFGKELLLNEFRDAVDKNIKDMQMMNKEIKVYKGMVASYEAQLTNKDLTIESLEKQIADMKEDQLRREMKETKDNDLAKLQMAYDKLAKDFANRCERIEELKEELETKQHIINHQNTMIKSLEQQKEELEKQTNKPQIKYVEVAPDPEYNEEVVDEVEEIVVPTTTKEKPVTNNTKGKPFYYDVRITHDAVKTRITVEGKTFYCVWSHMDNKPAYALVDNHRQYTRRNLNKIGLGIAYKYDEQIMNDLRPDREKLIKKLEEKANKNNTRKPETQVSNDKEINEAPEEVVVPVTEDKNATQTANDEPWAIDDMEFF